MDPSRAFVDRHVVVTGATGGLGGAVVKLLVAHGATVHVPMVEATAPPGLAGDRVHTTANLELGNEAAVGAFYAGLPSLWASIHLVGGFAMGPIGGSNLAELDRMLAINVRSCFVTCRAAVLALRRSGGGGRIVNVAARAALAPTPDMVAYITSKAAVVGLTQALAAEVLGEAILVNAIAPSIIDTPANRASMPDADHSRWPTPDDLALAIAHLASPDNRLTSGAVVPVYGRA